jgi:hypothetical protein
MNQTFYQELLYIRLVKVLQGILSYTYSKQARFNAEVILILRNVPGGI